MPLSKPFIISTNQNKNKNKNKNEKQLESNNNSFRISTSLNKIKRKRNFLDMINENDDKNARLHRRKRRRLYRNYNKRFLKTNDSFLENASIEYQALINPHKWFKYNNNSNIGDKKKKNVDICCNNDYKNLNQNNNDKTENENIIIVIIY